MSMMKFWQITLVVAVFALPASAAAKKRIFRDSLGRITGTATTIGRKTYYRDALGRTTGTATHTRRGTTYRSASGRIRGTRR